MNGGLSMFIENSRIRFFKNYLVWLWTIWKESIFQCQRSTDNSNDFYDLSCHEKAHDNEKRSCENSKLCESRMSLCLRLSVVPSRIQKCSFE